MRSVERLYTVHYPRIQECRQTNLSGMHSLSVPAQLARIGSLSSGSEALRPQPMRPNHKYEQTGECDNSVLERVINIEYLQDVPMLKGLSVAVHTYSLSAVEPVNVMYDLLENNGKIEF